MFYKFKFRFFENIIKRMKRVRIQKFFWVILNIGVFLKQFLLFSYLGFLCKIDYLMLENYLSYRCSLLKICIIFLVIWNEQQYMICGWKIFLYNGVVSNFRRYSFCFCCCFVFKDLDIVIELCSVTDNILICVIFYRVFY